MQFSFERASNNKFLRFRDLSTLAPEFRFAKSEIIQFYSGYDNIGNYLPVIAIQKMMGSDIDTWNIHDKYLDFDFINNHYKVAIIGGAGLLYSCFENFWVRFANECKLQYIIWGVGGCYPDSEFKSYVQADIIRSTFDRLKLVNIRDELTASLYGYKNPSITACPSLIYLRKSIHKKNNNSDSILYSHHDQLVDKKEKAKIIDIISDFDINFLYTDNIQTSNFGFYEILDLFYQSKIVITTRLHGAIIAYGLGIPYIAIPRDDKLREFCHHFGNGIAIENVNDLHEALANPIKCTREIQLKPIISFGNKAKIVIRSIIA